MGTGFMVMTGGLSMIEKTKNPEVTKPEEKAVLDEAAQNRIARVAEKAAEKASQTEQNYDENHQIFSK